MAFRTSRTSTVRGRPPRFAGRINGATSNHSASVRSLSYRRPRRSAAARWSGFHMRHLSPTQVPHKESQPIPETQLLSGWALRKPGGFGYACIQATESQQPVTAEPTMRQERIIQANIFDVFAPHEIGRELKAISEWLDGQGELFSLVAADLRRHGIKDTGRHGIPAEAVLRCGLLKQQRQLIYEELAFHLE